MTVPRLSEWIERPLAVAVLTGTLLTACRGDDRPTPPPGSPLAEESVSTGSVVIAVGDIAVCGSNGDEATAALTDSLLVADSAESRETLVLTLGDNAYPSGQGGADRVFSRCFSPSWGNPRIMRVIRPAPGNHDYETGSADPYFRFFGDKAGPAGKGYYSYDFAGWHIISLNSELVRGRNSSEERQQEDWLRRDLRAHPALCTLAYFHKPRFTSGPHGSNPRFQSLWQILYLEGADLVLNGHDHDYERFGPQTPTGLPDPARGIVEIVAGTGGGSLTGARQPLERNSVAHINGRFGVLKLMLGAGEFAHAFIDTDGRVWDPGILKCH